MFLKKLAISGLIVFLSTLTAYAEVFPSKPITIIVPYPPGGATDPIARIFSAKLSEAWGVPIIVENKPGAGTTIGMNRAAKASADGYTVVTGTTSVGTNPALYMDLPYDTMEDFTFLSLAVRLPSMLTVNPEVEVNSLSDLVTYLKENPGKTNYSSPGNGTFPHLAGELFKTMAGVDVVHVPYKGSGPSVMAAMSGDVTMVFDTFFTQSPFVEAGKLKAIAASGMSRIESMPDMPTVGESYPGFSASSWIGFMGPAGMPPEIAKKWSDEIARIAALPDVKESIQLKGGEAVGSTSGYFTDFVKEEIDKWTQVVKDAKIEKM